MKTSTTRLVEEVTLLQPGKITIQDVKNMSQAVRKYYAAQVPLDTEVELIYAPNPNAGTLFQNARILVALRVTASWVTEAGTPR